MLEAGFTGERRDVNRSCLRIRLILLQSVSLTAAPLCRTHGETLQRFVVVALVQIFWVTDFTDSSMYGVSGRVLFPFLWLVLFLTSKQSSTQTLKHTSL